MINNNLQVKYVYSNEKEKSGHTTSESNQVP